MPPPANGLARYEISARPAGTSAARIHPRSSHIPTRALLVEVELFGLAIDGQTDFIVFPPSR